MKCALLLLVCAAAMNDMAFGSSSSSGGSSGGSGSAYYYAASASASASGYSASAVSSASSASSVSSVISVSLPTLSWTSLSSVSIASSSSASASASSVSSAISLSSQYIDISATVDLPSWCSTVPLLAVPSSLSVSVVSSTLAQTADCQLSSVSAVYSGASTYLDYMELLMAGYPSVECAEKTLEQDIRSHSHTVSLIENALSSPSSISQPTYIEKLESKYPSVVSAYRTIFDIETSHPQFAYVQSILTTIEVSHPTILTDASIAEAASSPSTVEAESVVYYALEKSPSIETYLHTVAELASHYPVLSYAEHEIAYYEAISPSIVDIISGAVLSPISYDVPLPAVYPTLAEAAITIQNYMNIVPSTVIAAISQAVSSYSSMSANRKKEAKKMEYEYRSLFSAEEHCHEYKKVMSSIVSDMMEVINSPQVLEAPAVVANPVLAHAYYEIDSEKSVVGSKVVQQIEEAVCSPQKLKKSSMQAAQRMEEQFSSMASAFRTVAAYKKVNAGVAQKVSEEMNCQKMRQVQSAMSMHKSLAQAFKVIGEFSQKYHGIKQAQESVDCAESHSAFLFSNYEKFSSAEMSARNSIHHAAYVKKSMHQNAHQHQSMQKQSMHQSMHQSAHQSMHQSAHQSMHQAAQSMHQAIQHQSFHHGGRR